MILLTIEELLSNVEGISALITAVLGIISTALGIIIAVYNFVKRLKNQKLTESWEDICKLAKAAMQEAEKSKANGADKKEMVLNAVKAGCMEANIDINPFLEQLDNFIDLEIKWANEINNKVKK